MDLSAAAQDVLQLAEDDSLIVRTPNGKAFLIAEMDRGDEAEDDFAQEVALTRGDQDLRNSWRNGHANRAGTRWNKCGRNWG